MESRQIALEIVKLFRALSAIPHPSGQEAELSRAIAQLLRSMGGTAVLDPLWNLRCDLPASPGLEEAPRVCIQGHLDMVCAVAPGSGYLPEQDGIQICVEDDWLRSDGRSSLGADNLLADCAVLWLLRQGIPHGPLRLLFTTREEQALGGAKGMDPRWLDGVRYLVNIDGFRGDRIVIGSAGGCRQLWRRAIRTLPNDRPVWRVSLTGFPGGHSGEDIGKGRVNPLRLLARLLGEADVEIASLSGGTSLNAIPSTAAAVVAPRNVDALRVALQQVSALGGQATLEPLSAPAPLWSHVDRQAVLDFLLSLPLGVLAWLPDFPQVPACSANLGRVVWEARAVTVYQFLRGSPQAALDRAARGCHLLAERCGFALAREINYPPWGGSADNPLARRMAELWRRRNGTSIQVAPVHVGLEPSWLLQSHPNISAAVIGTTILNAHSVQEMASLEALPRFVFLLRDLLEEVAHTKGVSDPC